MKSAGCDSESLRNIDMQPVWHEGPGDFEEILKGEVLKNEGSEEMAPESEMKGLIMDFMDNGLTRRNFLSGLSGLGVSSIAANALADEFTPFVTRAGDPEPADLPHWVKPMTGTGGELLVAQLKAAGVEFIFLNASSGEAPVLDALIDEPSIQIIKAVQEGSLLAMADAYARATGKTPFVMIARPGLPNAMSMMFNAWRDYTPMVVMVDDVSIGSLGQDAFEEMDHMTSMTQTMTKWHWSVRTTEGIPETTRRAFKFASTRPSRPVFIAIPADLLANTATAAVISQDHFTISARIGPDPDAVARAAALLAGAENPMILAGDEVGYCQAEAALLSFAEKYGIPVVKSNYVAWSKPFPTRHPLYLGEYQSTDRFLGKVDVLLNLGSRMPLTRGRGFQMEAQVQLIQVRLDPDNLARVYPTEVAIVADIKRTIEALDEEIDGLIPSGRRSRVAKQRTGRVSEFSAKRRAVLDSIIKKHWADSPLSAERLMSEMDAMLHEDTIIVGDNDTFMAAVDDYFRYGPEAKGFFANAGFALGWGAPAAFGIKLANPDRPVVALISDGSFLFSGPQPLWSYARYRAPITLVLLNNLSYNNERNRIMSRRGRSFQTGRDLACYLGDPDVDYAMVAKGFGVDGEMVASAADVRPALERSLQATADGRSYLLDVRVGRTGSVATSTWHPFYDIASLRTRKV